jgi:hypothetical protein
MKETVAYIKHPERGTFGESSLCGVLAKTIPEL